MSTQSLFSRGYNSKIINSSNFVGETEESILEVMPEPPITLDPQQKEAVYTTDSKVIVVAGAGSGKTRVLTERIKYLVETLGVPAHKIVSITFTNMASEEMKTRLRGVKGIGDAFIGTIHSFANRLMKESGEKYTLLNDELDNQIHKELIEKYCNHLTIDRYLEYKDIKALADTGKCSEKQAEDFLTPSEKCDFNTLSMTKKQVERDIEMGTHISFGESVETVCKKRGIITFDELLIKAKKYFTSLGTNLEYLFVDEFQDVGSLEYQFIKALNAENYFFVGDDYQSIYGFKGGNVDIFLNLVKSEDFKTYYITNNYRNSTDILKVADVVINQVDNRVDKNIIPINKEKGEVTVYTKTHLNTLLGSLHKNNESLKDWFLLVRTNKDLFEVTNMCLDLDIPYTTFKREGMTLSELNKRMRSNSIKVLTVHTSKGLEIDNVILYGNFPLLTPTYRKNDGERKVMYVGVTRAKKRLIILN